MIDYLFFAHSIFFQNLIDRNEHNDKIIQSKWLEDIQFFWRIDNETPFYDQNMAPAVSSEIDSKCQDLFIKFLHIVSLWKE